ncbi:hypothetical protein AAFF_G00078670 [Aldrovandia affinis]|uniref:Uncharacterized protein n=1 Tax=Aldrovandia affinis TaxID=143900 RepID=A0AAD7RZW8_9TELE|nr:hypothetical protein AAFF_G00078670 [Aldrovandia affinis]
MSGRHEGFVIPQCLWGISITTNYSGRSALDFSSWARKQAWRRALRPPRSPGGSKNTDGFVKMSLLLLFFTVRKVTEASLTRQQLSPWKPMSDVTPPHTDSIDLRPGLQIMNGVSG